MSPRLPQAGERVGGEAARRRERGVIRATFQLRSEMGARTSIRGPNVVGLPEPHEIWWPGRRSALIPPLRRNSAFGLDRTRLAAPLAGVGCSWTKAWLVLSRVGLPGADRLSGVIRRPDGLPWPGCVRRADQTCRPSGYDSRLLARLRHDSGLRLDDSDLAWGDSDLPRGGSARARSGSGFCLVLGGLSCAGPAAVHRPEEA
jgi:hypothetical protein